MRQTVSVPRGCRWTRLHNVAIRLIWWVPTVDCRGVNAAQYSNQRRLQVPLRHEVASCVAGQSRWWL
jgi:hypothetical protein